MKFPKLHRYLLKQYKCWYNKSIYKEPKTEIKPKSIDKFIIDVDKYGSRNMIIIWYMVGNKKYCLFYNGRPMMYSVRPGTFLSVKKYLKIIDEFIKDLCKLNKIDPKIENENVNKTLAEDNSDNIVVNISETKENKPKVKPVPKLVTNTGPGEIPNSSDV